MGEGVQNLHSRAWYQAPIDSFLVADRNAILGTLTAGSTAFAVDPAQVAAWQEEIELLKQVLSGLSGMVFLEFNIPRMGSRIDAVVLVDATVLVIEFKIGSASFDA